MNKLNPLTPPGSLQQQSQRKSQVRLIVFSILALHVTLLGVLLIQGCKREEPPPTIEPAQPPPLVETNVVVPPPPPIMPPPTQPPTSPPVAPTTPPTQPLQPIVDTSTGAATEHVIAKNETFDALSKRYGVSVKAIQQANPGVDPTKLKVGQKVNIPPKPPTGAGAPAATSGRTTEPEVGVGETLYTVKRGDTLTKIAKDHGVTIKAIRTANNLRTDQIRPGQKLKLPAKAGGAGPATAPALVPPPSVPTTASPAPSVPPTF